MKLWAKLTLAISLIVVVLFSICGYLIIQKSLDFATHQIIRQYLLQHTNYRIFIEKEVYADESNIDDNLQALHEAVRFIGGLNRTALYTANNEKLYSSSSMSTDIDFIEELIALNDGYLIKDISNEFVLGVISTFIIDEKEFYFITVNNSIDVFIQRKTLQQQALLLSTVLLICVIICVGIFSKYITRPIHNLSHISVQIANGSYGDRTHITTNDEVGVLARSFDKMAAAVEERISSLEQAVRSREDFVANFSHELKTPMTAIMGYADMLRSHENSPEVQIKSADYIYKESKRISELSLKLMDLMGLSDEHISIEPVDVQKLKINIKEHLISNMQPATVCADKTLIISVLQNLCDNAEKAEATEILIKGHTEENKYKITVSDNGRGISKEDMFRIKEPFYIVDRSRTETTSSFGLGLTLCEKIANLHGTSLTFESIIGIGTSVSFELSMHEPEP
ncbi:HAMP domain-containing sensor histidine kinase [Sedimentibacter sp.]|uniref:sensor histidine kinase n=1 Tax=Sedimentibacter sp. TaxID=1960295 RepID=UPI0028AD0643|nr:HAMP domain-containing sensor histidine kinase [Sedimentibacter sp.]